MLTTDQTTELENMVDSHTLHDVLAALLEICDGKAEHLMTNWQDTNAAKEWQRASNALYTAQSKVSV